LCTKPRKENTKKQEANGAPIAICKKRRSKG
jgi:hypothetical protein